MSQTDTQSRLLNAAADLMWERSFQATSVDDLCQRADARKGSFYHFFSSKTELAMSAIEHSWANVKEHVFEPVFSNNDSGLTQIQNLVEQVHRFQLQNLAKKGEYLGCPFANLGQEMALQDEGLRQTLHNIFKEHYDYIEGALDKAVRSGEIPFGDNRQRAKKILALLEGAMLLAKVSNDPALFRTIAPAALVIAAS